MMVGISGLRSMALGQKIRKEPHSPGLSDNGKLEAIRGRKATGLGRRFQDSRATEENIGSGFTLFFPPSESFRKLRR